MDDHSNDYMYITFLPCIELLRVFCQILFAWAEALHAHGHTKEACKLAKKLAEEMLANPPDLTVDPPPTNTKGRCEIVVYYKQ